MKSQNQSRAIGAHRSRPPGPTPAASLGPESLASTRLRHFSDIVGLMSEPAFLLREDGKIAVANRPLCGLLRAEESTLRARTLAQLLCLERTDAAAMVKAIFDPATGGTVRLEIQSSECTGSPIALDAGRLAARDKDDVPLAFVRVRTLGDLAQRFQRVASRMRGDAVSSPEQLDIESRILAAEIAALEREAHRDGLTGLDNRRAFDAHLTRVTGEAARSGESVALVLLDIDDFKRINDAWGHPAGDRCLRDLGALLAPLARRPFDQVARVGGEEFALVLPKCYAIPAQLRAEQLRARVESAKLPHPDGHVTVSVGVAAARVEPGSSPSGLYSAADKALYAAKHAGKNSVRTA